uniref:Acetoacetyl-CoA synthetase n=1 Tax=Ditylenchus dipsaci TaxID=166011 RepID=A0A915E1N3_9BILA
MTQKVNAIIKHTLLSFPNVWTHGDFCIVNSQTNGIFVCGRSDTTLNRNKGLHYCWQNDPDDSSNEIVTLFVVLKDCVSLTDELVSRLKNSLRKKVSPRHVPNQIIDIKDIPYTNSGKKVELAVKQIINGHSVSNTSALRNPEVLELYKLFVS